MFEGVNAEVSVALRQLQGTSLMEHWAYMQETNNQLETKSSAVVRVPLPHLSALSMVPSVRTAPQIAHFSSEFEGPPCHQDLGWCLNETHISLLVSS